MRSPFGTAINVRLSSGLLILLPTLLISAVSTALPAMDTNWAQPPVGCVEEIVPQAYEKACPDLSQAKSPFTDLPESLSIDEVAYWQSHKKARSYCAVREVVAREARQPKSFSPVAVEISWMQMMAPLHRKEKIAAIYEASRVNHMPAQVLTGAIYQESLFAELGIAEDGANYSCGVGQINVLEWCRWANSQSANTRKAIGWPSGFQCNTLTTNMLKPYYEFAKTQLNGAPSYQMTNEHFSKMPFSIIEKAYPGVSMDLLKSRHQAIRSFINNCADPKNGIAAKAHELASLYALFVPPGLKVMDKYAPGDSFQRKCQEKSYDRSYPLDTGWLLAVGIYNAGPHALDSIAYYNHWSREDMRDPRTWQKYTPADLIRNIYWSGHYDHETDKFNYKTLSGQSTNWSWTQPCVLQRHIARVIQHVTRDDEPKFIDSLEGDSKCANGQFDPATNKLIKSAVPDSRQHSLGFRAIEQH
jgi:hypothetical protein